MISIKRLLEGRDASGPDQNSVEALMRMSCVLLDAMAKHMVRGNETDIRIFRRTLNRLARHMEEPQSTMTVPDIFSGAVEALETYCQRTTEYFLEQNRERHSMVAMLADTVAELSGQTDVSVTRLQAIEKQIEQASELDDIDLIPDLSEGPVETLATSYVAAFRLQRAEHVAGRFGEAVKSQMLSMIATQLKSVLGPNDRLLRWKGTSFVTFINSTDSAQEIRSRLVHAVGKASQQYIEVGSKSVLLSVGVDWVLFPQADHPSLDAIYNEVDAFLANTRSVSSPMMTPR